MTEDVLTGLLARIRRAFPDVAIERPVLISHGADNDVVALDRDWIFRFPRAAPRRGRLAMEMALLAAIRNAVDVPLPDYRLVSPEEDFGGYPLIHGCELRDAVFRAAPRRAREILLSQLAQLLTVLHGQPADLLGHSDGAIRRDSRPCDYAQRYLYRRRDAIAEAVSPRLVTAFDRFFEAFADMQLGQTRLVHSDLTANHILYAPGDEALAGVIDFGDVALGDPAHDFAFFWRYGDWAPTFLFEQYGLSGADPDLLHRSLWFYVCYCIDRVWRVASSADPCDPTWITNALPRRFDALGLAI